MSELLIIDFENRGRERVKKMGEVFTPEQYVQQMLSLLDKKSWPDENTVFFEPSCGHGNIVIPIYKKRVEAIYKKFVSYGNKEAPFYAVANSLNTLWAIDIDKKNINQCRSRVLDFTLEFFKEKLEVASDKAVIKKHADFFAHVLCAINWHIQENETLSSLSTAPFAPMSARQTKSGGKWFSKNGHKQIDFEMTWTRNFENCEGKGVIPLLFERANRLIKNIISGNVRNLTDFEFAEILIDQSKTDSRPSSNMRDTAVGL